ncbi:MAG: DNA modification methylase [Treponema sp.]|nr:MAG: DNA modification methylase [Treponema sp.]
MPESPQFLSTQIITYIGNKRGLLPEIENAVISIQKKLTRKKLTCVDLFSGSGIVARLLKQYSNTLYANDLELYSKILNKCYLTNKSEFPKPLYKEYYKNITLSLKSLKTNGIIYNNYAPKNDKKILFGERVFYTSENAKIIDTIRAEIENMPSEIQSFFLAPLLYSASVNVNTGGVFKGFYKDKHSGIGKFGGSAENALSRITKTIKLLPPVFSNFECNTKVFSKNANDLILELPETDIIYIDPPYNSHPYGSNYFMLNIIAKNKIASTLSPVSGIPTDWNRSDYNKKALALSAFKHLVQSTNAKYLIISYNSEGIIPIFEIKKILKKHGKLSTKEIKYNTYRASRNLKNRNLYVKEFLFILQKN